MPRLSRTIFPAILCLVCLLSLAARAEAAIYYVSAITGDDANTGTSPGAAFRTLAPVNALALVPGDEVRFFCGETWRAERLVITRSGSMGSPILFTSHPVDCVDRPTLSGAQPISGWSSAGANLWSVDLDTGANAGLFPNGIEALFRGGDRLTLGRWPNLGAGETADGYSTIDSEPFSQLTDGALPAGDWTGAIAHVKGIRWYILNREITADTGSTLTLGDDLQCIGTPSCAGWGYFLNHHPLTLDQEGEWFWDEATNVVTLFSTAAPGDGELEGAAILNSVSGIFDGGIVIGRHLQEEVSYVTIENLRLERWYDAGISFPENLELEENHHLEIRGNEIVDVESVGIRFRTWVWNAGALSGWRGGFDLTVEDNVIDGANHFGLDVYSRDSTFAGNQIRNIGRVENLGRQGLGCGLSGTNCTENGDGFLIRRSTERNATGLLVENNVFEDIAMNGLDIFGSGTVRQNVFRRTCITKGDCGAIRTFGSGSLGSTPVVDVMLTANIIDEVDGNTDGCHPTFRPRLGIGLYLDNFSRDLTVTGNTVMGASWVGLLFQNSTGSASDNVLYGNALEQWGSQLDLRGGVTEVALDGNTLVSLDHERFTFSLPSPATVTSADQNFYWSPFYEAQIRTDSHGAQTFAGWLSTSGQDMSSRAHDYTQPVGEMPLTALLVNDSDSVADLDPGAGAWRDLEGQAVQTPVAVAPYSSRVLVALDTLIFEDGFESGDTSAWN